MARLKRPQTSDASTRGPLAPDVRIPLALVVDATGQDVLGFSAAERAAWRDARRRMGEASIGGAFDPRALLRLKGQRAVATWHARRMAWAAKLFADET